MLKSIFRSGLVWDRGTRSQNKPLLWTTIYIYIYIYIYIHTYISASLHAVLVGEALVDAVRLELLVVVHGGVELLLGQVELLLEGGGLGVEGLLAAGLVLHLGVTMIAHVCNMI